MGVGGYRVHYFVAVAEEGGLPVVVPLTFGKKKNLLLSCSPSVPHCCWVLLCCFVQWIVLFVPVVKMPAPLQSLPPGFL